MQSADIVLYRIGWVVVVLMLGIGAMLPFFTFTKFYFFDDAFSLFTGIFHLLDAGEPVLFVLVFSFTILLPVYKLYILYRLINHHILDNKERHHYAMLLLLLGKWSMLDVFVVAILIMTVKLGAIASVEVHSGLYLFSLGVICSMLLTHKVVRSCLMSETYNAK